MAESRYGRDNKGRFAKKTDSYVGQFNTNKEKLSTMLVHTFPDDIEVEDGIINFEETVDNFSYHLLVTFDDAMKKKWFGYIIETPEECYSWVMRELPDLYDKCAELVSKLEENEMEE